MRDIDSVQHRGWGVGAVLLAAACSAAGGGDRSSRTTDDPSTSPETPDVASPDSIAAPPSLPTLPSAPPSAPPAASPPRSEAPAAAPPVATTENEALPTSLVPGSPPSTDDVPDAVPETDVAPDGSEPDDPGELPPSPDGLIRGADPTAASASREGPFDVDIVTRGLRDGPAYGTQTLFVPVGAEPPFAGVVVVPGFISPEASTRPWGPFLASHGIVTLTIGTNSGGDLPDVRARALLDGIETLKAEDARADSPIEGQMALDRFAVMGWSMGGGGSLIAANDNPELRAAISLAGWSPGVRFSDNEVPTLLLAGSLDLIAGGQSQGFFDSIPESTPKMLFEVAGGGHDIANDPDSAGGEVGLYGLSWLKVFLEGDERYRQFLLETPSRQSEFRDNL
jgi:dienelactone hydrolase